ncbi:serine/threonine/tyrosine protein kinase RAD53 KNAG_0J01700 [Huiozyma naganishii CBS 8797]|uniref:Serine/threonine-protein kinase RAD53 n=1 Tax=Huiozyma naganishii (strain ATCC MYA-139 / BCRC 22969 / CBS 8797 / KCTC 17520 / NBRC 10181 / NCYC 3082 / Yp74L-3) TaxID=1071383 RepID=J7SAK5_HUIN7|nr:hypothetical protein KNAG_0J01700 [Kazachstania naganishii CBS 8797]CCK72251.1 hypothetical protein KNAG_0J01700 [Kazachstania naganishii CBS 8797]
MEAMDGTQPTQQSTQMTQKFLVDKFTQEKISERIVVRIICTSGQNKIRDLEADPQKVLRTTSSIKKVWTFGRNSATSDYHLGNIGRLSNQHFQILLGEDGNLLLRDTSTNGTWLNGVRLEKGLNQVLSQGDEIRVGLGVAADTVSLVVFINDRFKQTLERLAHEKESESTRDHHDTGPGTPDGTLTRTLPQSEEHSILRDYFIQDEVVGQGAFATVKKAIETATGRTYAVKIINKRKVMGNLDGVTRELTVLQKLDHPSIVTLKGFYEDKDNYYMVMEFVSGGDLMDFVAAHGPVGEDAGREITRQILEAVKYIHSVGISHRDLKPDNILIKQDDPVLVKITDFGLAKMQEHGAFMNTFCGTLAYVAPEVVNGRQQTSEPAVPKGERSHYSSLVDMWSMGCLVYVILTGHLPFSGSTPQQLYEQIGKASYHEVPLKDCRISDQARDFIDCLLQVDPNNRLSAARALEHPWIQMAYLGSPFDGASPPMVMEPESSLPSQVSLMESTENQSQLQKLDEEKYEAVKAERDAQFEQLLAMSRSRQDNGTKQPFKKPLGAPERFTRDAFISQQYTRERPAPQARQRGYGTQPTKPAATGTNTGRFLTLVPTSLSYAQEKIAVTQGLSTFFIGRSHHCNYVLNNPLLSRVHCFLLKKRHPVGGSINEAPAAGLEDLWYCHVGSNPCHLNGAKIGPGQKCLLYDGDVLKILNDEQSKLQGRLFEIRVQIDDPTGLYNDGQASVGDSQRRPREVTPQTAEERGLVTRLNRMMATANANPRSVPREHHYESTSDDPEQRNSIPTSPPLKRAKLNPTTRTSSNLQFASSG